MRKVITVVAVVLAVLATCLCAEQDAREVEDKTEGQLTRPIALPKRAIDNANKAATMAIKVAAFLAAKYLPKAALGPFGLVVDFILLMLPKPDYWKQIEAKVKELIIQAQIDFRLKEFEHFVKNLDKLVREYDNAPKQLQGTSNKYVRGKDISTLITGNGHLWQSVQGTDASQSAFLYFLDIASIEIGILTDLANIYSPDGKPRYYWESLKNRIGDHESLASEMKRKTMEWRISDKNIKCEWNGRPKGVGAFLGIRDEVKGDKCTKAKAARGNRYYTRCEKYQAKYSSKSGCDTYKNRVRGEVNKWFEKHVNTVVKSWGTEKKIAIKMMAKTG